MTALSAAVASVLDRGEFCHIAAHTPRGPHLTPMVFAFSSGSIWVTTSRGSVKARAWRRDPVVGGLVRDGDRAVSFVGRAIAYDLLAAGTWPAALLRSPAVTAASLRFSRKNARFFAGYAIDAHHVPFAWTPPGRVFVEIRISSAMLLSGAGVVEPAGDVDEAVATRAGFRAIETANALCALPDEVRVAVGEDGAGVLALDAADEGPKVVPVGWLADNGAILATAPPAVLAGTPAPSMPAALGIDRPSWWRARRMLGCMVQGTADVFDPRAVRTGRRALASAIARTGGDPDRDALARLRPTRVVWWEGWESGSASVA